jgi:hypothetical protein
MNPNKRAKHHWSDGFELGRTLSSLLFPVLRSLHSLLTFSHKGSIRLEVHSWRGPVEHTMYPVVVEVQEGGTGRSASNVRGKEVGIISLACSPLSIIHFIILSRITFLLLVIVSNPLAYFVFVFLVPSPPQRTVSRDVLVATNKANL